MINDRNFYNEGLKISGQLIKQFDKEKIRGERNGRKKDQN
jgi:hypothetical protein